MDNKECDMPECVEKNNIKQIGNKVDIVFMSLQKIETALLGNEYSEGSGLIKDHIELKKEVKSIKGRLIFLSGVFSVISFIAGFIFDKIFK